MKKILSLLLVSSSLFSMHSSDLANIELPADKPRTTWSDYLMKLDDCCDQSCCGQGKLCYCQLNDYDPTEYEYKYIKNKKIDDSAIFAPHQYRPAELMYTKKIFSVLKDNEKYDIEKCFMDPELRNIKKKQLNAFLQTGYLALNVTDDGNITLKANGGLLGGGPLAEKIAYWTTKAVCYTVVFTAVTVVTLLNGGKTVNNKNGKVIVQESTEAAKWATGMASAGVGTIVAEEGVRSGINVGTGVMTGASICSSSSPIVAAGIVANGAAEAGYGEAAAKVTVAAGTIANNSHPAGLPGAIEWLSRTVGWVFGRMPRLP